MYLAKTNKIYEFRNLEPGGGKRVIEIKTQTHTPFLVAVYEDSEIKERFDDSNVEWFYAKRVDEHFNVSPKEIIVNVSDLINEDFGYEYENYIYHNIRCFDEANIKGETIYRLPNGYIVRNHYINFYLV